MTLLPPTHDTLHFTNCGPQTKVGTCTLHYTMCSCHWQFNTKDTCLSQVHIRQSYCQYNQWTGGTKACSVHPPGHRLNDPGLNAWQRQELLLLFMLSRLVMGLTKPHIQRVLGGLLPCRFSSQGMNFTDHLHLVPRLRMLVLYCYPLTLLHGVQRNNYTFTLTVSK